MKQEVSQLVSSCFKAARAGCVQEHHARLVWVAQQLQRITLTFEADPPRLLAELPMLLAALALAQSELLWYFRHINEVGVGAVEKLDHLGSPSLPIPQDWIKLPVRRPCQLEPL